MTITLKNVNTMARTPPQAVVGINKHGLYGAVPPGATVGGVLPVGQVYTTTGTSGQFVFNGGSNGTSWSNSNDTVLKVNQSPPELEVKGRMVLNGVDLEERLNTIEKVLQIPERDVILEKKHPKLKKLYDEYITALGKYRTFESIKGDE
jgi:hypothetical protein